MNTTLRYFALTAAVATACTANAADPWADNLVSYTAGSGLTPIFGSMPPAFFDDPSSAVGAPTRETVAFGGSAVTPFSQPGARSEVVSVGEGGSLTVSFDEPVTDDPLNPFGIDLLIFGNTFFSGDFSGPDPVVAGLSGEGGVIEISVDGINYTTVTGVDADGLFPTLGYQDVTTNFVPDTGNVLTDFTRPVDPSLTAADFIGLDNLGVAAKYAGSGGGAGIDLGAYGLSAISFVRITNPIGSGVSPEIDAFVDVRAVPEPTALLLLALAMAPFATRVR